MNGNGNYTENNSFPAGEGTPRPSQVGKAKSTLNFPWYVSLVAIILAALITFMATYSVMYVKFTFERNNTAIENGSGLLYDKKVLDALQMIYEEYYIGDIGGMNPENYLYFNSENIKNFDKETVTDVLASLYVAWTGDKYGAYYSPSSMDELENFFAGETVGIGVMITYDAENHILEVLYAMDDSPAQQAGIQSGDIIVGVGDKRVKDLTYEEVVNDIKGEEGSKVSVTVLRDGTEHTYEMTRRAVVINTVFHRMAPDNKTGIIKITEFTNETPAQFKKAVDALEKEGAEKLVFDLRDNGGGTLDGVMGVLSYILPKSTPLIKVVDKQGNASFDYADDEHVIKLPMAVLVNEYTASAAELFTINMRDHEIATVVGTTTYGKGVMQAHFNLPNGGMVKVTYKWYSSALSENYDGVGITPHVVQEMDPEFANTNLFKIADEDDNQLQKALEILNK